MRKNVNVTQYPGQVFLEILNNIVETLPRTNTVFLFCCSQNFKR